MVTKRALSTWYLPNDDYSKASKEREGVDKYFKSNNFRLFEIGELNVSGTFLLTDCIILHHWWIALMSGNPHAFYWIKMIDQNSIVFMEMILTTYYIWFAKKPRNPPDKSENSKFINYVSFVIYSIEDALYESIQLNIDLCYWIYILSIVGMEYIFDFINIFLQVEYKFVHAPIREEAQVKEWNTPHTEKDIELYEINQHDPLRFKYGKRIQSNLVFSMSTKSSKSNGIDDVMNADTDSYTAAIDTCTSESICKHKECFIG